MILTAQEYEAQEKQDKEEQPAKAEQGSGQGLNETRTGDPYRQCSSSSGTCSEPCILMTMCACTEGPDTPVAFRGFVRVSFDECAFERSSASP